jgi:hypothetical protein
VVRTIPAVAGLIGAAFLAAATTSGALEPAADAASVRCQVREVALKQPAYMVVDAVVRGDRLLLPDYTNGLREVDLGTGADRRSVLAIGSGRGQVTGPQHLGCGAGRCVVLGDRYFWIYYDEDFQFVQEYAAITTGAGAQPLVLGDRMVIAGTADRSVSGGGVPYLFVQYDDGAVVPLQEYPATLPVPDVVKRIHFAGPTAGGVGRLPNGGWLYVDPLSYGVFVFDERDRLTRAWRGANRHFRPPNFAGYDPVHDASGREYYSRWSLAQVQVKRPVALGDDLVAIVVGVPDGDLRQRHELDLYRLDGDPVATGIELPGVISGRLTVADAGVGRLVLVGQKSWEPSSATAVWSISITGVDK